MQKFVCQNMGKDEALNSRNRLYSPCEIYKLVVLYLGESCFTLRVSLKVENSTLFCAASIAVTTNFNLQAGAVINSTFLTFSTRYSFGEYYHNIFLSSFFGHNHMMQCRFYVELDSKKQFLIGN